LNVHQLKDVVQRAYAAGGVLKRLLVYVTSFGYRYGIPVDADMVLDVRFLPNPYFVEDLKPLDGNDATVRDYVFSFGESVRFMEKLTELADFLLPLYEREGKSRLNIALGCTGGRHRSVAIVEETARQLRDNGLQVRCSHRDHEKG
jgi:UPF0042 nucleotide-binding protein